MMGISTLPLQAQLCLRVLTLPGPSAPHPEREGRLWGPASITCLEYFKSEPTSTPTLAAEARGTLLRCAVCPCAEGPQGPQEAQGTSSLCRDTEVGSRLAQEEVPSP